MCHTSQKAGRERAAPPRVRRREGGRMCAHMDRGMVVGREGKRQRDRDRETNTQRGAEGKGEKEVGMEEGRKGAII